MIWHYMFFIKVLHLCVCLLTVVGTHSTVCVCVCARSSPIWLQWCSADRHPPSHTAVVTSISHQWCSSCRTASLFTVFFPLFFGFHLNRAGSISEEIWTFLVQVLCVLMRSFLGRNACCFRPIRFQLEEKWMASELIKPMMWEDVWFSLL